MNFSVLPSLNEFILDVFQPQDKSSGEGYYLIYIPNEHGGFSGIKLKVTGGSEGGQAFTVEGPTRDVTVQLVIHLTSFTLVMMSIKSNYTIQEKEVQKQL